MKTFELTNKQREYFGLEPVGKHWDKVSFKGDAYRPSSILYFDGDIIKRHIVSTENQYMEKQYDEPTKERTSLLPKTNKGKEKKLTASVLEQRQPTGVYLSISNSNLIIGNHNTQTTFYSSQWDKSEETQKDISELVSNFINISPENHLEEIELFKNAKRRNIKYKAGDYFCFKLNRSNYGFGKILLDVNKIRKKKLISSEHGLGLIMGPPLIIQFFAYRSPTRIVDIAFLDQQPSLPADVMMDNLIFYGEFEIIGHRELVDEEFEFPISYGRSLDQRRIVFLQWGLIHIELPQKKFNKYLIGEKDFDQNPYGYYSNGFRPRYNTTDISKTIDNNGEFDFTHSQHYKAKWDLRNPNNLKVKNELFKVFGLDINKSYLENSRMTKTPFPTKYIEKLK